ncbi:hypothetical protein [Phaeobacter gallaeciensis]|uniref:hypothetical protein n=1 Tax=Phaeobacter gallaeciensis TaxID=60890 RepID=UPI00237F680F|nr:hypothetical protein [Phaeobacter gallaeciensis]MDE4189659.1 hypothetical protein [Phaeobacter gallaeciensis]MDE4198811.1 hypothetical protein [Phaeobacter gallaeciensis]MDE4202958.1 hypothetical protein [Phaeobacter gallaeciensis]MDE4207101.1 hypothetical protein [Phaeobacter gallaeciensis]MDE4215675.1 hypothetical protein [Phaeobacter gallaeciensis]
MIKIIASGVIALFGALAASASFAAETPDLMLVPPDPVGIHEMSLTDSADAELFTLADLGAMPYLIDAALPETPQTHTHSAAQARHSTSTAPGQPMVPLIVSKAPAVPIPLRI